MSLSLPKCDFCKHYHRDNEKYDSCDAFPDGIPLKKMNADESEECANGIKYEEEQKRFANAWRFFRAEKEVRTDGTHTQRL